MESLKIRTGEIHLQIVDDNDNPRGIFHFNPEDIGAAERFFEAQKTVADKQKEYSDKADLCETDEEKLALLHEIVDYLKNMIDTCFYEGASETLFGDNCSISMFDDFFTGITPYYESASQKRMAKYKNKSKRTAK